MAIALDPSVLEALTIVSTGVTTVVAMLVKGNQDKLLHVDRRIAGLHSHVGAMGETVEQILNSSVSKHREISSGLTSQIVLLIEDIDSLKKMLSQQRREQRGESDSQSPPSAR